MEEYTAETFTLRGYTVKVIQDQYAENPRKGGFDNNFGHMACFHSRYDLGDERHRESADDFLMSLATEHRDNLEDWLDNGLYRKMVPASYDQPGYKEQRKAYTDRCEEIIQKLIDKHYLILPLYLYDHSGITMSTGRFSCPWDSGQVGWIYCTKAEAIKEFASEWKNGELIKLGKRLTKKARDLAFKALEQEVATYDQYLTGDVYGFVIEDSDGNDVDSCWGFFGLDYAIAEAKFNVPKEPCMVGGEGADEAMEATLP